MIAIRLAIWADFDAARVGWRCEQCHKSPLLWRARGYCGSVPMDDACGAFEGKVEAGLAIGGAADHLGAFETCPLAIIARHRPRCDMILKEYQALKRFGVRCDPSIPFDCLLAADIEVQRLEAVEQQREAARAEAKKR